MKKQFLLGLLLLILLVPACGNNASSEATPHVVPTSILNGGFESSNLSGWTVEYGDAYDDDSVSSVKTFSFDYDPVHNELPINHQGNWYLSGKGFDGRRDVGRIGAIRSSNFVLTGNGVISFKLAGGATTTRKGADAPVKNDQFTCYLGIYTAKDDKLVVMQHNTYFAEHTTDYVDYSKYAAGVYATDNFKQYNLVLREYLNQEMYIRIVDNDRDLYYGYLSVDDIRIGYEGAQQEGEYYIKTRGGDEEVEAPSIYEIKNAGFETGNLAGWTVLEGQAFSHEGVNNESTWWNEHISYQRDGNYHYGHYKPSATGRMRSSTFILGGTGYVTFKLGGCQDNDLTYLSFYVTDGTDSYEVARYSHRTFWNFQFPYVANGMRLLNLVQYIADLREYIGKTMYIEVVDNNTSSDDLGCIVLDSIKTYWESAPTFYGDVNFFAHSMVSADIITPSEYQIENGSFEEGSLTGWVTSWSEPEDAIGVVTDKTYWWGNVNLPFNKKGVYLFSGEEYEGNTGYIKSSSFKVGGINKISFLLGGANDPRLCYVSIFDSETNIELKRFSNHYFHDLGTDLVNNGSNLLNMVQYVADLSEYEGRTLYIKVTDNATNNWGLISIDSVVTYYESETSLPATYYDAVDVMPISSPIGGDGYQVLNGDFETGDLTGWTLSDAMGTIVWDEVWWNEWYSYERQGLYHFSGLGDAYEYKTGDLVSSEFTISGINKISFKLGAAKNSELCYVSIIDSETGDTLVSFGNPMFNDSMTYHYYYNGQPITLSDDEVYMANMATYIADLSVFANRKVKICVHDGATNDWGLVTVDDFITYYAQESDLPAGVVATPLINE